jgi:YegS/Rv2252/BmrU family lipid kinase
VQGPVKDVLLIVNPASAAGHLGRHWPRMAARLRSAGLDFDSVQTERPAQATVLAGQAVREGRPLVVAVGGDGTINEVANGFFEGGDPIPTSSRLGVIPMGTGGDLRRSLAIPRDPEAAARILVAGSSRRLDAGRATFRLAGGDSAVRCFVNVADAGIGGEVVRRVNSGFHVLNGEITFTLASAITLIGWRNRRMRVLVDGALHELVAQQVVVANCQYFGGGMRVAPRAVPDDGLFDVLVAGDLKLRENLRLLGPLRRGTHLDRPHRKIEWTTARRVEVSSPDPIRLDLDGEQPGVLPVTFEILPGALEVVVP